MAEKYGFTADEKSQLREQRKAEREQKKGERLEKTRARNSRHAENVRIFDVFRYVMVLMLTILVVSVLMDTDRDVSLVGILDYLESAPTINLEIFNLVDNLRLTADWNSFNFFRDFLKIFVGAMQFVATLGGILWNAIFYLFGFVKWIFLG